jgi:hypothetical protein
MIVTLALFKFSEAHLTVAEYTVRGKGEGVKGKGEFFPHHLLLFPFFQVSHWLNLIIAT